MTVTQLIEAALPLAAIMVPAFVLGFGAIWLAVHNGLTDMRKELHGMSERVNAVDVRVARIEGRLGTTQN